MAKKKLTWEEYVAQKERRNKRAIFRMKVAHWIHKRYPKHFCWASLVSWAYSYRPFWTVIKDYDKKGAGDGCRTDSQEQNSGYCDCGQWCKGKHCSEADYKPPFEEIPAEAIEPDDLPF